MEASLYSFFEFFFSILQILLFQDIVKFTNLEFTILKRNSIIPTSHNNQFGMITSYLMILDSTTSLFVISETVA